MKMAEAKRQLEHAIKHQKTISIPKLDRILQSMNISYKQNKNTGEVQYLKEINRKLRRACGCGKRKGIY